MNTPPAFPADAKGWQRAGETRTFGRDTVFEYMDGAGELYLAYDFQRVLVQDYARPDAPRIVAEVYEMTTSEDAYGVFTHDPEGEDVGIGQGNAYAAGLLRFWKGPRFFRILAERDTPEAKAAVVALARSLATPLAEGPLPSIVRRLPPEGLEAPSVRYFHTQVSLNSFYYLADANLLGLSPDTDAAMGTYRPPLHPPVNGGTEGGEKILLLLIRYPSARQAESAYRELNRVYLEDSPPAGSPRRIATIERGRQVGVLVKDRFLALAFEAKSRTLCDGLLDRAAARF